MTNESSLDLFGKSTLTALRNGTEWLEPGTIERLVRVLSCQQKDVIEFVENSVDERPGLDSGK